MGIRLVHVLAVLAACGASGADAQRVLELDIAANDIAYSTQTQMLYATVPSSAGAMFGNRIIEISPGDAHIVGSVFAGSEPVPVATSPDAPMAYAGLDGAAAVRPVDLTTLTAGTQFSLGSSAIFGPLYAADISVMPGSPNTIAVSRRDEGFSPSYQGVAIFDDGVMRPNVDTSFTGGNSIAFGSDSSTLYGYDNEVSDFNLCRYNIDVSGVAGQTCVSNVISGYGVSIRFDNGTIFATSGAAVDGDTLTLMGTYASNGPVVVDNSMSAVLFVSGDTVNIFDRDTYVPTRSFTVPSGGGFPIAATNCGSACLAIVYDSGRILVAPDIGDTIFADGFD